MDRCRVPEGMGAYPPAGLGVVEARGVAAHYLVDAEAGERAPLGREHRGTWRGLWLTGRQQRAQQACCLLPERASTPLVALAVQADERVLAELQVPRPEVGHFLCPGAGVVEKQQERPVAEGEAASAGEAGKEVLDFVELQKPSLGRG